MFSYLMATIIVGVGLMVAAAWKFSEHPQIVNRENPTTTPPRHDFEPRLEFVGRITRMVDCQWANPKTEPVLGAHVPLGRKYAMSAGLMEVSYDSGAKVLLQGPVTYEIESAAGGYLSVGKLTARLEKKSEIRGQRPESANQKSEIRNQKSFTIRTPTAIVTDLGTEFGVEVQASGLTRTHVFRGTVALQAISAQKTPIGAVEVLRENESGQVQEARAGTEPAVRRLAVDPAAFVRSEQLSKSANAVPQSPFVRWQAYRDTLRRDPSLLAYYDFQQKPGAPKVLANVAANAHGLYDGIIENARWIDGRTPGKHALLFNGAQDYVSINLPQTVDDLTLATWIYVESGGGGLLMSDGWKKDGLVHWQLADYGQVGFDVFDSSRREWAFTSPPVFEGDRLRRWTHVVVAFDHDAASVRFYVDGRSLGQTGATQIVPICIGSARIGQWNYGSYVGGEGKRNFSGRIDELAIFGRLLTLEEIRCMFQAGNAPSPRTTP
jgi:hypothetical protein